MKVSLRSIGRDNWRSCISLKLNDDQARFMYVLRDFGTVRMLQSEVS
jgi:hypothetical protein